MCSCREDLVLAVRIFNKVAGELGMSLRQSCWLLALVSLDQFKYLGSLVEARGGVYTVAGEVNCRMAQFQDSVFTASNLILARELCADLLC